MSSSPVYLIMGDPVERDLAAHLDSLDVYEACYTDAELIVSGWDDEKMATEILKEGSDEEFIHLAIHGRVLPVIAQCRADGGHKHPAFSTYDTVRERIVKIMANEIYENG